MYDNILVPIDVSHPESGRVALNSAKELANASGARLTLLCVIADVPNLVASQLPKGYEARAVADAEEQLKELASESGLTEGKYSIAIRDGQTYHEILQEARKISADLIVVVSHRPEVRDYLLGTVAAKVVRHAECSVLVVRE